MADKPENATPLPPYISYKTFTNFMDKMKNTTVPPRIDSSVLTNYAGSVARQLVLALKYMGLIQQSGATNDVLKKLVRAYGTEEWKDALGEAISDAFVPIIGDLDIDTATYSQLDERFRKAGTDGVVRDRAIGFYLSALTDAGLTFSPHFKKPRRVAAPRKSKGLAKGVTKLADEIEGEDELAESGVGAARFNFPIPGKGAATITLPADVATDDWLMIDSMIRAYIQRKDKGST
ncbi:MAG: DUF5343 domain-containing protein [Candidatus Korobacteraceae bacterium]